MQAGYNYQFGKGLIGIEADVNGNSAFKNTVIGGDDQQAFRTSLKADVSGTIRARAGAVLDNTLFYVTGGLAWANFSQSGIEFENRTNNVNFGLPTGRTANSSGTVWGGVIGAGVEYALTPKWTVGGEFLHMMYQDSGANFLNAAGVTICRNNGTALNNCLLSSQLTTDVVRLRLNYRFGDPVGVADATGAGMYRKAPALAVYTWTGFYVGGNAGGGIASSYFTDPCFVCSTVTPTRGFFTGGVQAGYNYQFGNAVVGIEADVSGNSQFKDAVLGGEQQNAFRMALKADTSGTIRGRAGVAVNNALVYVTGGAAWADVRQTGVEFNNVVGNGFGTLTGTTANASGTLWGGVIGAGVEFALNQNWTAGGEFLHTVYEDRDANIRFANGASRCNGVPEANCVMRSQLTTDVARVRVNYKFGGNGDPARMAQAPAAVYGWTGFYVGANAGGGMAASAFTDPCYFCSSATPTRGYFTGGVQAGYNHQFGRGLIGVEADVNGNSTFKNSFIGGADTRLLTVGLKADVSGTIRARAGLVVNNALIYVTGGAAWADVRQSGIEVENDVNSNNFGRPSGRTANASGVLWGGVIGAGVEFAMSPNWRIGAEFLHTVYQDRDANLINQDGTNACGNNLPAANCVIRGQLTTDVARVRLNYQFGSPVVAAKY